MDASYGQHVSGLRNIHRSWHKLTWEQPSCIVLPHMLKVLGTRHEPLRDVVGQHDDTQCHCAHQCGVNDQHQVWRQLCFRRCSNRHQFQSTSARPVAISSCICSLSCLGIHSVDCSHLICQPGCNSHILWCSSIPSSPTASQSSRSASQSHSSSLRWYLRICWAWHLVGGRPAAFCEYPS